MENDMERELRKSQNILVVLGYGVIMFGAWSLFKCILTCTLDFGAINELVSSGITAADMEGVDVSREAFVHIVDLIVIGMILIISVVDTLIRIRVGLSAVAEGKGRKRGKFYLAAAVLLILISAFSIYLDITELISPAEKATRTNDTIAGLLFDITSLATVIQMIYYAKKVRKLSKELSQ